MANGRRIIGTVYYAGLVLLLALILLQWLDDVVPATLAVHIGHNSEAYLGALMFAAWIQFVRPRLQGARGEWPVAIAAGVACLVIGIALVASDLPSRFRTLNETFFAAALLLPYLQLRRPLSRSLAYGLPLVVLVVVLIAGNVSGVTDLAETSVMLLLLPIGLDLVDRGILEPDAVVPAVRRYGWYAALVLVPVVFALLRRKAGVDGVVGDRMQYALRGLEGFIAVLFVEVYFAVFLGRIGRSTSGAGAHRAPATVDRR
jgi:hypothetical protein